MILIFFLKSACHVRWQLGSTGTNLLKSSTLMLLKKTTFVKTSSSLVGIFQLDTEWTNCADFISSVLPSKFYHGGGNQKNKKKKRKCVEQIFNLLRSASVGGRQTCNSRIIGFAGVCNICCTGCGRSVKPCTRKLTHVERTEPGERTSNSIIGFRIGFCRGARRLSRKAVRIP